MGKLNTAVIDRSEKQATEDQPGNDIDDVLDLDDADTETFVDESLEWEGQSDDDDDDDDDDDEESDEDVEITDKVEELAEQPAQNQTTEPEHEIIWDEDAERRKDEADFHAKLKELNDSVRQKQSYLNDAKEELKVAKAELLCAQTDLLDFVSDGVQYRQKPKPKKAETKPAVTETKALVSEMPVSNAEAKPAENESTDWRSIPTAKVVEGIEGLGKKKLEALIDEFPTLGKLEDARGEASKEFAPFKSKLPKGFGDELTSRIEEKMLQAVK